MKPPEIDGQPGCEYGPEPATTVTELQSGHRYQHCDDHRPEHMESSSATEDLPDGTSWPIDSGS